MVNDITAVITQLIGILGQDNVLDSEADRKFYSTDLSYTEGKIAQVVIRPGNTEELSACVALATGADLAIVPRGGGMSYTRGYQPEKEASILIDMRRMNRVLDLNTEDLSLIHI